MASHMHLTSLIASESKQPYKVAGLRFNPKFISSISKGLSRAPSPSEWEADEDDASPSPTLSRRLVSPRASLLSFSPFLPLPPLPPPIPLSLVGASECAPVHRCIASTPLHYDSYIAIFIISAVHRCPQSRLTSVVSSSRLLPSFPVFSSRAEPLLFFGKSLPVNSRPLEARIPEPHRAQDRSMENSLEEISPGVRSVVTRIVED